MPGRDGTGPTGFGPGTGRGMGLCRGYNVGRFGRFAAFNDLYLDEEGQKDLLKQQKVYLEKRLESINKILKGKGTSEDS